MKMREIALSFAGFATAKSFIDYLFCMEPVLLEKVVTEHKGLYTNSSFLAGLLASAAYGALKRDIREGIKSIPIFAAANLAAENTFYFWINLFGDKNGCYGWYTGNPLNPDGSFGYSWTNPGGMLSYAASLALVYGCVFLAAHGLAKKFERK